jgi:streptogramin lyase
VWTDTAGSTWWSGDIPRVMGTSAPVSGPAAEGVRVPDAAHPVIRLTDLAGFTWFEDEDRPDATARDLSIGTFYRVAASVDRVEVRMTVEGEHGPWFTAPVHDGYVYIPAVAPGPHSTSEHIGEVTTIEDRAFDHDGASVPIVGP